MVMNLSMKNTLTVSLSIPYVSNTAVNRNHHWKRDSTFHKGLCFNLCSNPSTYTSTCLVGVETRNNNMHLTASKLAWRLQKSWSIYFNSSLKTELIVDASPVGLRAILTQVTTDGGTNIKAYAAVHSMIAKVATVKPKERLLQWSGELNTSTCTSLGHPSKSFRPQAVRGTP